MNDLYQGDWLRFEKLVLPYIDNAFNLARWLLRSREDAEAIAHVLALPCPAPLIFTAGKLLSQGGCP